MTVNELLQRLVELAQRGRGTWKVMRRDCEMISFGDKLEVEDVLCEDETKEVVIE